MAIPYNQEGEKKTNPTLDEVNYRAPSCRVQPSENRLLSASGFKHSRVSRALHSPGKDGGPSHCRGQGWVLGRVTRRADAPQRSTLGWMLGGWGWGREGLFSADPISSSHPVVPPEAPESTRKTWGGRDHLLEWPGLATEASSPWFWVSLPLSSMVGGGERWSAPSLPPNLLGYLLILVGTLVLSQNLRDFWQGLRQNEIKKPAASPAGPQQCERTAQLQMAPGGRPLATDSPEPPAFGSGGFLCLRFTSEILTRTPNSLLDISIRMETPRAPQVRAKQVSISTLFSLT